MDNKKITKRTPITCFVAGRSGGHIIPALAMAEQLIAQDPQHRVMFFSTNAELDHSIISNSAAVHDHIVLNLDNVPRNKIFGYPRFVINFVKAFWQSFTQLRQKRPQKIVSTGGYIAIPVCLAGRLLRIPIELFELNAVPGQATSLLAPLATTILHCFEKTRSHLPLHKCTLAQYPIRFAKETKAISPKQARINLGLNPFKKTILILGGSQGSLFINERMKELIAANNTFFKDHQIIHQTGEFDCTDWDSWYVERSIQARIFTYHHAMQDVYMAANIIICRSGAGTLFEALFFGKRCITIPLETDDNNHQLDNAYTLSLYHPYHVTVMRQKEIIAKPFALKHKLEEFLEVAEI